MRALLAIWLFLPLLSLSQQKDLVQQNGLGIFQFGEPASTYEAEMEGTVQISYGQDYYLYTGNRMEVYYGLKVKKVNLGFFRDKLNYIDLYFRKLDDAAFRAIHEMMVREYGESATMEDAFENGLIEAYQWTKGDISLRLKRFSNEAVDWEDRNMTVIICQIRLY